MHAHLAVALLPSSLAQTNNLLTYRNKRTTVRAQGTIPNCEHSLPSLQLNYAWTLVSATAAVPLDETAYPIQDISNALSTWNAFDPRVVDIPANRLQVGVRYEFTAAVVLRESPNFPVSGNVVVTTQLAGLDAVISGGNRVYSSATGFTLSGANSIDYDGFGAAGVPMQYAWTCLKEVGIFFSSGRCCACALHCDLVASLQGAPCETATGGAVTSSAQSLVVGPDTLAPGDYEFTLTVFTGNEESSMIPTLYRSAKAVTTVKLVAGTPPSLNIQPIPGKANPNSPPVLKATVAATPGDSIRNVQWVVLQGGEMLSAAKQVGRRNTTPGNTLPRNPRSSLRLDLLCFLPLNSAGLNCAVADAADRLAGF